MILSKMRNAFELPEGVVLVDMWREVVVDSEKSIELLQQGYNICGVNVGKQIAKYRTMASAALQKITKKMRASSEGDAMKTRMKANLEGDATEKIKIQAEAINNEEDGGRVINEGKVTAAECVIHDEDGGRAVNDEEDAIDVKDDEDAIDVNKKKDTTAECVVSKENNEEGTRVAKIVDGVRNINKEVGTEAAKKNEDSAGGVNEENDAELVNDRKKAMALESKNDQVVVNCQKEEITNVVDEKNHIRALDQRGEMLSCDKFIMDKERRPEREKHAVIQDRA